MHRVVIEKTSADGRGRRTVYYYQGHGISSEKGRPLIETTFRFIYKDFKYGKMLLTQLPSG